MLYDKFGANGDTDARNCKLGNVILKKFSFGRLTFIVTPAINCIKTKLHRNMIFLFWDLN